MKILYFLLITVSGIFTVPVSVFAVTLGTNLVPYGDFEGIDIQFASTALNSYPGGFKSDYPNVRYPFNPDPLDLTIEGTFGIGTNPSENAWGNPFFPNGSGAGYACVPTSGFGDHTSGSGNMMVVNGGAITTQVVWQLVTPIPVEGGKDYRFSAWISTFGLDTNLSRLRFEISTDDGTNWQTLGSSTAVSCDPAWKQTNADKHISSNASAILRLVNDVNYVSGNDFAIDDIFFGTVSSPSVPTVPIPTLSEWAMIISGQLDRHVCFLQAASPSTVDTVFKVR